jgi:hypothetical protein
MRYMIREKFFHLGEDSTIMNDAGQPIMQVDGKVLSLHDRLIVRDLVGNEVANVHRRLMTLTPTYEISRGGDCAGYLGRLFITIKTCAKTLDLPSCFAFITRCVYQENRERASLCSMNRQANTRTTRQRDDLFSVSVEEKQGKDDKNTPSP